MIKLPSLSKIFTDSTETLRRFPFTLLSAAVATFSAIYLVEVEPSTDWDFLGKLIMVSILGISLLTAAVLSEEKLKWAGGRPLLAQGIGVLLLVIYYFTLPGELENAVEKPFIRYALFFIGTHLLVSLGPYIGQAELNGFWQYNKTLFLRILTAVLYSAVLFIGLSVALLSIDHLLGFEIDEKRYMQLWLFIVGIFNTWFFLAGLPQNLDTLNHIDDYPKGLKIFTQYVMMPLVIIYLLILYVYTAQIIFNWEWPVGWVANLVLSFSIVGILSLLLLYPIRERIENAWIKTFSRRYYLALLPLVILLLLAIWRRLSEYGFTENRYFVLVAGLWLGGMAIYFSISDGKNIKLIPGSLCIIVFLISFGPWGAFNVAESSQINRLEEMLKDREILVDGQIQPTDRSVPVETESEVSAVVRYLRQHHGYDRIEPWFDEPLTYSASGESDSEKEKNWKTAQSVVEMMGLNYHHRQYTSSGYLYLSSRRDTPLLLGDYQYLLTSQQFQAQQNPMIIQFQNDSLSFDLEPDSLEFVMRSQPDDNRILTIQLDSLIHSLTQSETSGSNYNIPVEKMTATGSNRQLSCKLYIRNINLQKRDGIWQINSMNTDLLLRFGE
ncbi:MAG: DUF4153 domain-containing protein [Balneolaceae bacterium]|nr:DUF4153 domain-containing protein [Balneolaceae bacterium]